MGAYGAAAADGVLGDAEAASLIPLAREVPFAAIRLYFLLKHIRLNG